MGFARQVFDSPSQNFWASGERLAPKLAPSALIFRLRRILAPSFMGLSRRIKSLTRTNLKLSCSRPIIRNGNQSVLLKNTITYKFIMMQYAHGLPCLNVVRYFIRITSNNINISVAWQATPQPEAKLLSSDWMPTPSWYRVSCRLSSLRGIFQYQIIVQPQFLLLQIPFCSQSVCNGCTYFFTV